MAPGVILLKPERIFHREAGRESERVKGGEGKGGLKAECNLTELQKIRYFNPFQLGFVHQSC